jgi:hypothetical protein
MTAALRSLVAGMFVSSFLAGSAAHAIVGGEPDGDGHPNVGTIFTFDESDPTVAFQWCSGTLIAPNAFLTAGHCFDEAVTPLPSTDWAVTFDPEVNPTTTWYTGKAYRHPSYAWYGNLPYPDVAVVILDDAVDMTPARLPTENLLDQMNARDGLRGTRFESVGYGVAGTIHKPKNLNSDSVDREVAILNFQSLKKHTILLTNNATKNWEGICLGDSGDPNFLTLKDGTTVIAAITERTDPSPCTNLDGTARIDIQEVRDFIFGILDEHLQFP